MLVVGLGNSLQQHKATRHNAGVTIQKTIGATTNVGAEFRR